MSQVPTTATLSSLSPPSAAAGGPPFTLTVKGSGFASGCIVLWNLSSRPTTVVDASTLQAQISSLDIAVPGTPFVQVMNPSSVVSPSLTFTVFPRAAGSPVLASLSPPGAAPGGPAFRLTVNGSNFDIGSVVNWNGSPRPTTVLGSFAAQAQISAADIASVGTATITVFDP